MVIVRPAVGFNFSRILFGLFRLNRKFRAMTPFKPITRFQSGNVPRICLD